MDSRRPLPQLRATVPPAHEVSETSPLDRHFGALLRWARGRQRLPRLLAPHEHEWRAGLPGDLRDAVAVPAVFERALEYEMPAERILGRDAAGQPCYCSYHCVQTDLCCEDGEVFVEDLSFAEQLCAWRLADGGWLVRRSVTTGDRPELERVEYRRSESMPR